MKRRLKSIIYSWDTAAGIIAYIIFHIILRNVYISSDVMVQFSAYSIGMSIILTLLFSIKFMFSSMFDSYFYGQKYKEFQRENHIFKELMWSFKVIFTMLTINYFYSSISCLSSYYEYGFMPKNSISLSLIIGLNVYNTFSVYLGICDIHKFSENDKKYNHI